MRTRRLAPVFLGWFFMTAYSGIQTHSFHTKVACDTARGDVLRALGWVLTDKRVQPCREDVAPPITATVDGTFIQTPPVK